MFINTSNLATLNADFKGIYQGAFQVAENWSDPIVTRVPVGALKGVYGFASATGTVRKWVGERISIAMQAHSYELPHEKFELTMKVPRGAILRDNLGIFTAVQLPEMAAAVKKHPDQVIASDVFAANPTGFDGVPFWDSAHPTYNGSNVYTNEFTLDATSIESFVEELGRVRAAMATIRGQNGIPLATNHNVIVCPVAQTMRVIKATKSTTIPQDGNGANIDNPLAGVFKTIIEIPELDLLDPTVIYTMDLSKPLKPFLWQIGSNPILRAFTDQPDNMHAFMHDEYVWGIDGDNGGAYEANAGVTLPFLTTKCTLNLPT